MAWLRTDYRLRGKEEPPPLHAQVCAAADAAAARGGERAARGTVRRFFEEQVMLTDPRDIEYQVAAGACTRIDLPVTLLRKSGRGGSSR